MISRLYITYVFRSNFPAMIFTPSAACTVHLSLDHNQLTKKIVINSCNEWPKWSRHRPTQWAKTDQTDSDQYTLIWDKTIGLHVYIYVDTRGETKHNIMQFLW